MYKAYVIKKVKRIEAAICNLQDSFDEKNSGYFIYVKNSYIYTLIDAEYVKIIAKIN